MDQGSKQSAADNELSTASTASDVAAQALAIEFTFG